LCAEYGTKIVTGEDATVAEILGRLEALPVQRVPPGWEVGTPPAYPRGIGQTRAGRVRWDGEATDRQQASELKRQFATAFTKEVKARADALQRELQAKLREVDGEHNAALWATVRERFDYPVFVAAPKAVGITSTGETGEKRCQRISGGSHGMALFPPGLTMEPGRRTRRIFACPPLPDPTVEGARALDCTCRWGNAAIAFPLDPFAERSHGTA
jgi:hypothetical protein